MLDVQSNLSSAPTVPLRSLVDLLRRGECVSRDFGGSYVTLNVSTMLRDAVLNDLGALSLNPEDVTNDDLYRIEVAIDVLRARGGNKSPAANSLEVVRRKLASQRTLVLVGEVVEDSSRDEGKWLDWHDGVLKDIPAGTKVYIKKDSND